MEISHSYRHQVLALSALLLIKNPWGGVEKGGGGQKLIGAGQLGVRLRYSIFVLQFTSVMYDTQFYQYYTCFSPTTSSRQDGNPVASLYGRRNTRKGTGRYRFSGLRDVLSHLKGCLQLEHPSCKGCGGFTAGRCKPGVSHCGMVMSAWYSYSCRGYPYNIYIHISRPANLIPVCASIHHYCPAAGCVSTVCSLHQVVRFLALC